MARGKSAAPSLQIFTKGIACIRIGGKETCRRMGKVFVDSGASASVIPRRSLEDLQEKIGPFPVQTVIMHTAAGPTEMEMAEDVEICAEDCCFRGKVLFSDGLPGEMTLGADFFKHSKPVMNFVTGKMACGRGRVLPLRIVK